VTGSRVEAAGRAKERIADLLATLDRATDLVRSLELINEVEGGLRGSGDSTELDELRKRVGDIEADQQELGERLVDSEHQRGRLMNLYVATYQLHATLDPEEVQATIAEIAVDLLGAERFVLLLRTEDGSECEVALSRGLEEECPPIYREGRYRGGDSLVDASLNDGVLRLGASEGSDAVAVVPLQVQDAIVGVLVLLNLFPHKTILADEDRDLLDLLAAHAASALFAARVYATADRKLRTLQSLVQLVRGA